LQYIDLRNMDSLTSGFSGPFPNVWINLQDLEFIDLSYSGFNGSINSELGYLTKLTHLSLAGSDFDGTTIPSQLGRISNLDYLDLADSGLVGCIPSQLGYLNKLIYLSLRYNMMNGSLPLTLSNLTLLETLIITNIDGWGDDIFQPSCFLFPSLSSCDIGSVPISCDCSYNTICMVCLTRYEYKLS